MLLPARDFLLDILSLLFLHKLVSIGSMGITSTNCPHMRDTDSSFPDSGRLWQSFVSSSSLSEEDKLSSETVGSDTGCESSCSCAIDLRQPERESLDSDFGFKPECRSFVLAVVFDFSIVGRANSELRKDEVTSLVRDIELWGSSNDTFRLLFVSVIAAGWYLGLTVCWVFRIGLALIFGMFN